MAVDPEFKAFIQKDQEGSVASVNTISSLSKKRVSVTGYPLEDCYYFAVSILPDKEDLMKELPSQIEKIKRTGRFFPNQHMLSLSLYGRF